MSNSPTPGHQAINDALRRAAGRIPAEEAPAPPAVPPAQPPATPPGPRQLPGAGQPDNAPPAATSNDDLNQAIRRAAGRL